MKVLAPDGKLADADEIEIIEANDPWHEYKLADGTTIRMKPIVVRIVRLRGYYQEDGSPVYLVESKNVVSAVVPDELRNPAIVKGEVHEPGKTLPSSENS